MSNLRHHWDHVPTDSPIALLDRQRITGKQMLLARVHLKKGCKVALHHHESEQMAYVLTGRVKWGLCQPGTAERDEFEMSGGEVLHLPSNLPHEVEALEDTLILDVLAPVGPMGVDSQG